MEYFNVLRKCALFANITVSDLIPMLECLDAKEHSYQKGNIIFAEGDSARYLGIVLSGKIQIVRVDYYGNRSILTTVSPSQLFAESFACAKVQSLPVDIVAAEDTTVLLIDALRITKPCGHACSYHHMMIFNLLNIVARKNLLFHQKIEITSKRTTREKLMTYLHIEAKKNNSNTFVIPYDRQELADYLGVERSGLSAEIGKLCKEGVLICKKSQFTILNNKYS
ncbi:MAG: Crp/Fnr family transcriptional regulator [Acutalibacteraceae bacterium]|jgi:CRP-like cAMP-binding protein